MAARRPRLVPRPPIESGAVETEITTVIIPSVDLSPTNGKGQKHEAELSGPELAEIKLRNDIVDKAIEEAKKAQDEAQFRTRVAQLLQNELSQSIRSLIVKNELADDFTYRVDIDRARLVPVASTKG